MTETTQDLKGQCLCGAIKIAAKTASTQLGACHCSTCFKWTGGPLMALECGTQVDFEGEDQITVFDSSAWAERGFCKHCGTHLFYRLKAQQAYMMPVGIFDNVNPKEVIFDHQIFIEKKPDYYTFSNKTSDMTGAEVFAKFTV